MPISCQHANPSPVLQAVEAFRKLKNEKTQALREAKMNLTHLSSQKNAATRLKEDIKECEDKQASYEKEIADLGVEIEAAEQVQNLLYTLKSSISPWFPNINQLLYSVSVSYTLLITSAHYS